MTKNDGNSDSRRSSLPSKFKVRGAAPFEAKPIEKKSCPTCSHTCEKRVMKLWNGKECPDWKPAEKSCEKCQGCTRVRKGNHGLKKSEHWELGESACSDWKPKSDGNVTVSITGDEGVGMSAAGITFAKMIDSKVSAAEKQGDNPKTSKAGEGGKGVIPVPLQPPAQSGVPSGSEKGDWLEQKERHWCPEFIQADGRNFNKAALFHQMFSEIRSGHEAELKRLRRELGG